MALSVTPVVNQVCRLAFHGITAWTLLPSDSLHKLVIVFNSRFILTPYPVGTVLLHSYEALELKEDLWTCAEKQRTLFYTSHMIT